MSFRQLLIALQKQYRRRESGLLFLLQRVHLLVLQ